VTVLKRELNMYQKKIRKDMERVTDYGTVRRSFKKRVAATHGELLLAARSDE